MLEGRKDGERLIECPTAKWCFGDRQRRAEPPVVWHPSDTRASDDVRGCKSYVLAVEADDTAARALIVVDDTIPTPRDDGVACVVDYGKRDGMFTRTSDAKAVSAEAVKAAGPKSAAPQRVEADAGERSVIGNDLTILGQGLKIIGRGVLQIDGNLSSDVQAMEVIVGRKGKVTGMVAGQQVSIEGQVTGSICARSVTLQASSNVEGDVHHLSLSVEQGAMFEGRSRRASSEGDLDAVIERGGSR